MIPSSPHWENTLHSTSASEVIFARERFIFACKRPWATAPFSISSADGVASVRRRAATPRNRAFIERSLFYAPQVAVRRYADEKLVVHLRVDLEFGVGLEAFPPCRLPIV